MNILKSLIIWLCFIPTHSYSQWRIAGICIGEGYRRGMGIAC